MLAARGIVCSMSRRGDCLDDTVAESFFVTLEKQLLHREQLSTRGEAATMIFEYIEVFYNRRRRHSVLGYPGPAGCRAKNAALATSAE